MWDIYFNVFGPIALGWFIFVGGTMYLADQKDQASVDFKRLPPSEPSSILQSSCADFSF